MGPGFFSGLSRSNEETPHYETNGPTPSSGVLQDVVLEYEEVLYGKH